MLRNERSKRSNPEPAHSTISFVWDISDGDRSVDDEAKKERKRKRRSRWMGSENEKAVIPGMPTILPPDLPADQAEAYVGKSLLVDLYKTNLD